MAQRHQKEHTGHYPSRSLSPETREAQLISLAVDLAEKQLSEGTASSQVIAYYLKRSDPTERLKKEILEKQKALIEAKTESYQSSKRIEELYANALSAMQRYGGSAGTEDEEV